MRKHKVKSKAQKIGELGESVFRTWAIENGVTPTKPAQGDDYGIDFFCTVFRETDAGAEEATGTILAVMVRATSAKEKQRIRLDRSDAGTALRVDNPFAIVGVDIRTREVRFRFVDEELILELQAFLRNNTKSLSWSFDSLDSGNNVFAKKLTEVCRPAYQQQLRWARARAGVSSAIPGARVSFAQDEHGGIIVVLAPWATMAFDVEPGQQERVGRLVFEKGYLPLEPGSGVTLRPEVRSLTDLVSGPVFVGGPLQRPARISVETPGMPKATIPVGVRIVGDESAYVLRTGLYLSMSKARHKQGQWIHELGHGIARDGTVGIGEAKDELGFLKGLRKGALLRFEGGHPFPIEHWGSVEDLGPVVETFEKAVGFLGEAMSGVHLADVVDPAVQMSAAVIVALLDGVGIDQICPGFVFGKDPHKEPDDRNWVPCGFRIPIVMNLVSRGVVVWCVGTGSLYMDENMISGFRAERQDRWEHEVREERFNEVGMPEVWLHREWPPIPISIRGQGPVATVKFARQLPFAGEFFEPN